MAEVDELLLQQYLVTAEDVRKCPRKDCKFAGYIEDWDGGVICCKDSLECVGCGHNWTDP